MSDYVHNKVVRLPIPKNISNIDNLEITLKEKLGELWNNQKKE